VARVADRTPPMVVAARHAAPTERLINVCGPMADPSESGMYTQNTCDVAEVLVTLIVASTNTLLLPAIPCIRSLTTQIQSSSHASLVSPPTYCQPVRVRSPAGPPRSHVPHCTVPNSAGL